MTLPLARIVILLPVLWISALLAALPCGAATKHVKKRSPGPQSLSQVDFSRPVVTLATPERNVAIFRMAGTESSNWSYVVVRVDEDGTRITYGDEKTVGSIVKDLSGSLVGSANTGRRTASVESGGGVEARGARSFNQDTISMPLVASGERSDTRCAASAGWRFETNRVRVNYCNDGFETARIERAIDLLNLAPGQL